MCVFQSQQRELTVYHAQEQEREGGRRLSIQKQEYEATIKRHLSFIDQVCLALVETHTHSCTQYNTDVCVCACVCNTCKHMYVLPRGPNT